MKYCTSCCLPDTKPGVVLDEQGRCNGCRAVEIKDNVDWVQRVEQLDEIVAEIKAKKNTHYDCVVPVSGGKDSWYQAWFMAEKYGLKILAVTMSNHLPTTEGLHNLNQMIKNVNIDHVKISLKPSVIKKLRRRCFIEMGEPNWAEHCCIFSGVVQAALLYDVPLIVWGEDVAFEFGGIQTQQSEPCALNINDNDLIKSKSVLDFTRDDIDPRDVFFYMYPEFQRLKEANIKSIYLGHFDRWDGRMHYNFVKERGFRERELGPLKGNYIDYDNIDEKLCEINIWFKYLKFGFWRPTDQTCYDVWNKRMTREEAVEIVNRLQDDFPEEYFQDFLNFHDISEEVFWEVADRFRNKDIWKKVDGKWQLIEPLR